MAQQCGVSRFPQCPGTFGPFGNGENVKTETTHYAHGHFKGSVHDWIENTWSSHTPLENLII